MKQKVKLVFVLCVLIAPTVEACEETYLKYFSWAALKQDPPKPTNEIAKEEAQTRESKGQAYYIGTYCKSGKILYLEKRWNKKQFSKMKYKYENGKYTGIEIVKLIQNDL